MGPPPLGSARPGRANPEGVQCLYLADQINTAIHEIRAGIHDYVCVGKFKLNHDTVVVDLRSLGEIHPFTVENMDFLEYAVNREHLKKIGSEISRPQRRGDSGLVYRSTLYPKGYNLAFFYEDLLKCKEVETHEIKELNYLKELAK
jgi:RES domain-containing protein